MHGTRSSNRGSRSRSGDVLLNICGLFQNFVSHLCADSGGCGMLRGRRAERGGGGRSRWRRVALRVSRTRRQVWYDFRSYAQEVFPGCPDAYCLIRWTPWRRVKMIARMIYAFEHDSNYYEWVKKSSLRQLENFSTHSSAGNRNTMNLQKYFTCVIETEMYCRILDCG